MNEYSADATPLPLGLEREIDRLCDSFEAEWRAGSRPRVEDYLGRGPAAAGAVLREELAAIEVECRWRAGEVAVAAELATRLGVPEERVEGWLRRLRDGGGSDPGRGGDSSASGRPEGGEPRPEPLTADCPKPAAPVPPCAFGEYDLLEKLGESGMGAVYKARHRRLGKLVALKLVRPDLGDQGHALARFLREMQALGRLDHPNLVEAQYAGEHGGVPFLVMKLVEGVDLARLVRRAGPLRAADACELARQAALGLQHLHECGLVHRDVKPSNLMLTPGGQVKVLDLGLARLASVGADEEALTGQGLGLGTADYMAPEQAEAATTATSAADVYGLGCTLFHLLTGRAPYADRVGPLDKMQAHRQAPVPPLPASLPPGLARVVERMLAKRPQDRFPEPRAVAEALAPYAAGADLAGLLPTGDGPAGASPPAPTLSTATTPPEPATPVTNRRSRRRLIAAAVLAAVVLAITATVVTGPHWRRTGSVEPAVGVGQAARPKPADEPAMVVGRAANADLTVRALRVRHFANLDEPPEPPGYLGEDSFATRLGDLVRVSAELSEPAHAYLLAFNPDGQEQLCLPADPKAPPPRLRRLDYPPRKDHYFTLDDGAGLQAFVLVASRKPLPAYADWRKRRPPVEWKAQPARRGVVWRGDGQRLEPQLRGTEKSLPGIAPLAELCRRLRSAPEVEALAAVAFVVEK
jgi:serine/threonine protein kinase